MWTMTPFFMFAAVSVVMLITWFSIPRAFSILVSFAPMRTPVWDPSKISQPAVPHLTVHSLRDVSIR